MIKNNKGLSVVELIIAIALLAVMTTVLTTLLVTGMNFYKKQSADISLQMQSQIVMAQIREYATDCTAVKPPSALNKYEKIKVLRELSPVEVNGDRFIKYVHTISYDENKKILTYNLKRYLREGADKDIPKGNYNFDESGYYDSVSAELVSGVTKFDVIYFAPEYSDVDDNNGINDIKMISVDLTLEKAFGSRSWSEKQNITLRNMLK